MGVLSMYLPPFAPDYSGVCSVLFDLNALIAIHDAAGCTGNYTGFDEPRWYGSRKMVYCSGLREIDAVMGNDQKFVDRIAAAAAGLKPEFLAMVGSPVPMVIGTDFEGFARDLAKATGLPAFGFATNGTKYYSDGVFMAVRALLERFAPEPLPREKSAVNILGATPLDFSRKNYEDLRRFLAETGHTVRASLCMDYDMAQLIAAPGACANIAVTQSGVRIAKLMQEMYGMPYLAGLPVGAAGAARFLEALARVMRTGESETLRPETTRMETLFIGDQVIAGAIAHAMGGGTVGAIYGREDGLLAVDVDLPNEQSIIDAVNNGKHAAVVADPLILALIGDPSIERIPVAHFAVSGKTGAKYEARYIASCFDKSFYKERAYA